jgi:hydroxypyruvate isomerase
LKVARRAAIEHATRSDTNVSRVRNLFAATIGCQDHEVYGAPECQRSSSAFWRERAEEWRAVAYDTIDPEEKRLLLELVADYERLAEHAAQREPNQS